MATSTKKKVSARRFKPLKWLAYGVLAFLLLVFIGIGILVGTEFGRHFAVTNGVKIANKLTPFYIEVEGFESESLKDLTFDSLTVKHNNLPIAQLKHTIIRWMPSKLINNEIIVDALSVKKAVVHPDNLPKANDEAVKKPKNTRPPSPAKIIDSLPHIIVRKIDLGKLSLKTARSQQDSPPFFNYDYSLASTVLLPKRAEKSVKAHVNLFKQGGETAFTKLNLSVLEKSANAFKIDIKVLEKPKGLITKILKIEDEAQATEFMLRAMLDVKPNSVNLDIDEFSGPISNSIFKLTGRIATQNFESVDLTELVINLDGKTHTLSGTVDKNTLAVDADINNFDLNLIKPWLPSLQEGYVDIHADISGDFTDLEGSGNLNANFTYDDIPLDVQFNGTVAQSKITLDTFLLAALGATLNANGIIDPRGNSTDVKATLTQLDANTLIQTANRYNPNIKLPFELELNIDTMVASISGALRDPNAKIEASVTGKYKEEPLSVSVNGAKNGNTITLDKTAMTIASSRSHITGTYGLQSQDADVELKIEKFPLELLRLAGVDLPPLLEAQASADLKLDGNIKSPSVNGSTLVVGRYEDLDFKFDSDIQLDERILTIKALKVFVQEQLVANISAQFDEKNFESQININEFPTKLLSTVGVSLAPGVLNADISASGTPTQPVVDGSINLVSLVNYFDEDGDRKKTNFNINTAISTSKERVLMANTRVKRNDSQSGQLDVRLPLAPISAFLEAKNEGKPFPLNAAANGSLDLRTILLFSQSGQHLVDGNMLVDLNVDGDVKTPNVMGQIKVDNASYANQSIGTELRNVRCALNFNTNEIDIDSCSANDDEDGKYSLGGTIVRPQNKDDKGKIDVTLSLSDVNVIKRKEIESQTTGEVNVTGDFKELFATGQLNVTPLSASIASNPPVAIPTIDVEEVFSFDEFENERATEASRLPIINLDLNVTADKQAFLRGRGLDAELQGKIRVYGTVNKPEYDGEFEIVRGSIELFNKTFTLTQGNVTLATNAVGIYIVGTYEKDRQRVQITVSGSNSDIDISFSAVPSLPEDEILAFIIFGKKITDITPFEAIQLAGAVQQLRGGGNGLDLVGGTRKALGVDTLSIESTTTESGESGVNVGVGKYLNERVYLELQKTPNPSQPWKGSIEIELLPNVTLESSTGGAAGIEGATLKWKRDY